MVIVEPYLSLWNKCYNEQDCSSYVYNLQKYILKQKE